MTHTYAKLPVSEATYNEIRDKLVQSGYRDQVHNDKEGECVDMHGIAITKNTSEEAFVVNPGGRASSPEDITNAARKGFNGK